jgi:phage baseplate assembly protein W
VTDGDFRGNGWRFPIRPEAGGGLGYVGLDDNVAQSVELLLRTAAGERLMRPEFGTTAPSLVFEADSEPNLARLEQALADALRRWEPRVEVEQVRADPALTRDGLVEVTITYRVLRTNTQRNLVFPFYLLAGGEAVEQ